MAARSAASSLSSEGENIALQPCHVDCVPAFRKNTNPNIIKECPLDMLTPTKCFVDRETERAFYDAIDWSVLKDNITNYMNYFLTQIAADIPLTKDIEKLYGYGPLQEKKEGRRDKYAEFRFKLVENEDYRECNNLILKVSLYRGDIAKGKQSKVLCHISLHPKLPVYVRNKLRSRSGCGFYKKPEVNAAAAAGAGAGEEENSPFGYAIESIDWDGPLMTAEDANRPWLALLADTRVPGTFRRNPARFETLFKADFTDGRKEDRDLPDLKLVNDVHKGIYNKFVETWNTTWLPGVEGRASAAGEVLEQALPRLLRTAGGTRKRRRRRNKTRRLVAHKH